MNLQLIEYKGHTLAELLSEGVTISTADDALDPLGNAGYQGADGILVRKDQLTLAFFDLKSGLAGEILQKFSNYRMRLAIAGDLSEYSSKSLKDFIYESNKAGRILFVASREEGLELLARHISS